MQRAACTDSILTDDGVPVRLVRLDDQINVMPV